LASSVNKARTFAISFGMIVVLIAAAPDPWLAWPAIAYGGCDRVRFAANPSVIAAIVVGLGL